MSRPVGYIVWEGPSHDGSPIALVVNCVWRPSKNDKTKELAQSYIIRTDQNPYEVVKSKQDSSICGRCPFAGGKGCYVSLKSVGSVFNAYTKGSYVRASPEEVGAAIAKRVRSGAIRGIRSGSYGDPAFVPLEVWQKLLDPVVAEGGVTTGYTHQWTPRYAPAGFEAEPGLSAYMMASGHTRGDAREAETKGWRSFVSVPDIAMVRELQLGLCPASKEAGHIRSCSQCGKRGACNGRSGESDRRSSMGIVVHGDAIKLNQAKRTLAKLEGA